MRRFPHLADAADIIQWSERIDARSELPRLIRRLISHENDRVVRLDMRSGEGVGVVGYDGVVQANKGTPFVPEGLSVWEMGTGADPRGKANKDYKKRTEDPGRIKQEETTFVFLTSRRWNDKSSWEDEKHEEGKWLDVRAYDVDDIERALEGAPVAHILFSEAVGKGANDVQSLEDWWSRFSALTSPPITSDLVLAGRREAAASLLSLVDEDRRRTTIRGRSAEDVLAFVASVVSSVPEDAKDALFARCLVVRDPSALRRLGGGTGLLLLVPLNEGMLQEAQLIEVHHVIFASLSGGSADIDLLPIEFSASMQILSELGLKEEQATPLARAAHKSLSAYVRLAAVAGHAPVPEWSRELESMALRRAWLAGAWNSGRSGDIQVLSDLMQSDYSETESELLAASRKADPLLVSIGGSWAVVSPEDSWDYCKASITQSDLEALERAVQTVLGAVDPSLELEPDKRWMAAIYGKSRIHSSSLRKGLATTVCLLGCRGESVPLAHGRSASALAQGVVASLLDRANADESGNLWSSLSGVLPLLAEAAPDVFLRAVQSGASGDEPTLLKLFGDQEGDVFSVSSPHTGLLWALELLAWSPDYFALSIEALARLAELDPGGELTNRPAASLHTVFCPWLPQTSAGPESRLAALDGIVSRHPDVGRSLLLALLPEHSQFVTPTYSPRFQDWRRGDPGVSYVEYWQVTTEVGQRLLGMTTEDEGLWLELIDRVADMPPDLRTAVIDALGTLDTESLPGSLRADLWNELNELTGHHREFADAAWALPEQVLDDIVTVQDRIEPHDPIERFGRLFTSHAPDIGVSRRGDMTAYQTELASLRSKAAAEILAVHGLEGLLSLARTLDTSGFLGAAVSEVEGDAPLDIVDLLDSQDNSEVAFANGYVRRKSGGNISWLLSRAELHAGRPILQARLLLCSDDLAACWEAATRLGQDTESAYWDEFQGYGRGSDFELLNEAAKNLIVHGRPAAALDLLSMYSHQQADKIDRSLIVAGFEAILGGNDREMGLLASYDISRLLELLRESELDEDELALLEWRLLPASDAGLGPTSPVLQKKLSRDPAFFAEVVSLCYKTAHGPDEHNDKPKYVIQNADTLLHRWSHVPGADEPGGMIDEDRLNVWVEEARRLLGDLDREEIGDHLIGAILAHAGEDPDGIWPPVAVRDVIERLGSAKVESGLKTERYNMRGGTSRALDEGGAQEVALAKSYSDWAEKLKDSWPRTAGVLRSLADGYRDEARMHDEEAQRFEEGLDLHD